MPQLGAMRTHNSCKIIPFRLIMPANPTGKGFLIFVVVVTIIIFDNLIFAGKKPGSFQYKVPTVTGTIADSQARHNNGKVLSFKPAGAPSLSPCKSIRHCLVKEHKPNTCSRRNSFITVWMPLQVTMMCLPEL